MAAWHINHKLRGYSLKALVATVPVPAADGAREGRGLVTVTVVLAAT